MEDLTCGVCSEPFDEKHHRPKSVPCGHTVCSSCLFESSSKGTTCPLDMKCFRTEPTRLPDSLFVLNRLVSRSQRPTRPRATLRLWCTTCSSEASQHCIHAGHGLVGLRAARAARTQGQRAVLQEWLSLRRRTRQLRLAVALSALRRELQEQERGDVEVAEDVLQRADSCLDDKQALWEHAEKALNESAARCEVNLVDRKLELDMLLSVKQQLESALEDELLLDENDVEKQLWDCVVRVLNIDSRVDEPVGVPASQEPPLCARNAEVTCAAAVTVKSPKKSRGTGPAALEDTAEINDDSELDDSETEDEMNTTLYSCSPHNVARVVCEEDLDGCRSVSDCKSLQFLRDNVEHVEELQLCRATREHLQELENMPKLRELTLWYSSTDLHTDPVLFQERPPERSTLQRLILGYKALPAQSVRTLLAAHRSTLSDVSLRVESDVDLVVKGLLVRDSLQAGCTLTLQRSCPARPHILRDACLAQLAAARTLLPGVSVQCRNAFFDTYHP